MPEHTPSAPPPLCGGQGVRCSAPVLLSGIQINRWRVTLIELLDSRLQRAGMTAWHNIVNQPGNRSSTKFLLDFFPRFHLYYWYRYHDNGTNSGGLTGQGTTWSTSAMWPGAQV